MKTLDELDALYEAAPSRDLMVEEYATKRDGRGWVVLSPRDPGYRVADFYDENDAHSFIAMHSAWPEVRERLRRAEVEREVALKAYAATWSLLDRIAHERELPDDEAEWLYTGQPAEVWDALRAEAPLARHPRRAHRGAAPVNDHAIDLMRHALGVQAHRFHPSKGGLRYKKPYRNHFCAGGDAVAAWDELVALGLAEQLHPGSTMPYPTYRVTDAGREVALAGITFKRRWGYATEEPGQ